MSKENNVNTLARLELPKRWELLERKATEAGLKTESFVERVEDSASRVDELLQRVRTGGGGLFEVFFGKSGSGKTTFLKTLPQHFYNIKVISFPRDRSLTELSDFILSTHVASEDKARIILVENRDNPSKVDMESLQESFSELLETFRDIRGAVLVLWPVTRKESAIQIAEEAWITGRDSMVAKNTKGLYNFSGLPKDRFYPVADITSRNLTGDSLAAFGITSDVVNNILSDVETIADFFAEVDMYADTQREKTWSILKERHRARLWVVLPGDVPSVIRSTVLTLTQGTRNRADIDSIAEFIDQPDDGSPNYISDWKDRRPAMAHLLRAIDLRLFELPPNVSLAAIRSLGDERVRQELNKQKMSLEDAKRTMRSSKLYKEILIEIGVNSNDYSSASKLPRDIEETSNEYRRIQALASKGDKSLNKAVGRLIEECLKDDASNVIIESEKKSLPRCELKPDICLKIGESDYICLEPTWRSTNKGIPGEIVGGQNTLATSHMKKYILDKAMQYVKSLSL